MSYTPSDISHFEETQMKGSTSTTHCYLGTLGYCEYEMIATECIKEAKAAGQWVDVPLARLAPLFERCLPGTPESIATIWTTDMIRAGYLTKTDKGFRLTEGALENIAKRWPANRTV